MKSDVLAENFPAIPKGFRLPTANITANAALTPEKVTLKEAKISAVSLAAVISGVFVPAPFSVSGFNLANLKYFKKNKSGFYTTV